MIRTIAQAHQDKQTHHNHNSHHIATANQTNSTTNSLGDKKHFSKSLLKLIAEQEEFVSHHHHHHHHYQQQYHQHHDLNNNNNHQQLLLQDHSTSNIDLCKAFMLVRKICNHPYLALQELPALQSTSTLTTTNITERMKITDELYFQHFEEFSGKFFILKYILKYLIEENHAKVYF
jgi:hypothetical protein